MSLTSSLEGNLAGLTGSQYDNAFDPGAGRKLGIRSDVTADQAETWFGFNIQEVLQILQIMR